MISIIVLSLLAYAGVVNAECPNACSSHGKCGAYDMCICYRNWMANDCSERTCPFGLAHVDTPKGDLDASGGALSGASTVVVTNNDVYPYGTTEQFPSAKDSVGDVLSNTAHYYMECSNKGICDRSSGVCSCVPGYEGSSCQRASCPSSADGLCSGHGTCLTIAEYSAADYDNIYKLWDKDSTMACSCDPGYFGPDCSLRECKHGFDPLYYDDEASVRYSNWTYVIYAKDITATFTGNYSIIFYDVFGEDWVTDPIDIGATCDGVVTALESLPNNVVPSGTVRCRKDSADNYTFSESLGTIYDSNVNVAAKFTLVFPANAGKLKQIAINTYLDGVRPTLYTSESTSSTLGSFVYANGFTGEETDFVNDFCEGVTVTLEATSTYYHTLSVTDTTTTKLLKSCLGDADGNSAQGSMANEVYNWDYGTVHNPHLIKLVDSTSPAVIDLCLSASDTTCTIDKVPGFYATLIYDGSDFKLFTPAATDYSTSTEFYVFTTTGTLQMVSNFVTAFSVLSGQSAYDRVPYFHSNVMYVTNVTSSTNYYGSVDCQTNPAGSNGAMTCLDKDDYVLFFNDDLSAGGAKYNPKYLNIYQVKKMALSRTTPSITLDTGVNGYYSNGVISSASSTTQIASYSRIYKFTPPTGETYAGECSGRGVCNTASGTCECFSGYTKDDCSVQNALAK